MGLYYTCNYVKLFKIIQSVVIYKNTIEVRKGDNMELHVLLDNNTIIDRYFKAEPGVSYYIKEGDVNILFDTGYSDVFLENAKKMQLDMLNIDYIVISHGHIDHSWGLIPLMRLQQEAIIERLTYKKPSFVSHPDALKYKRYNSEDIGTLVDEKKLKVHYKMQLTKEPYWLTDKLVFLGEIERTNNFEGLDSIGTIMEENTERADYLLDDSALVYQSENGLVIITACSHSGICNIVEYAKKICKDDRIVDVVGGFHLLNPSTNVMDKTVNYFEQLNAKEVHACHCTDLKSKIALSRVANLQEVGVGMVLKY